MLPMTVLVIPAFFLSIPATLRTPPRRCRINFVSKTSTGALPSMANPANPAEMVAKLDRILGQLTTLNNWMDSHDKHIVRTEKFQYGDDAGHH